MRWVVLGVAVLALLTGCSQARPGVGHPDPVAVARVAQERDCDAAAERLTSTVSTFISRVDGGGVASGSVSDILQHVPTTEMGAALGRACGPDLIGPAYSGILVDLNHLAPVTLYGRLVHQAVLSGLCTLDQKAIPLDGRAQVVCAGRVPS